MMSASRRRALVAAAGMGCAAAMAGLSKPVAQSAEHRDAVRLDELFPSDLGAWRADAVTSAFVRPPNEQGKLYGIYDQVLERVYVHRSGQSVMLSVAFGSEQSAGVQMHRPEVCYQFGGFRVDDQHDALLMLAGQPVQAVRLHARKQGRSEPITYWTVLGGRVMRDGVGFKLRQLSFGLQRRSLDGMIVRVSSIDEDAERAYGSQAAFSDALARALTPTQRGKVIGDPGLM